MIVKGWIRIIWLLAVIYAPAAIEIGNTLINFKDDSVRGIYLYGTNFLGVVLDKEVYVGQLQDETVVEIARFPLNTSVHTNSSLLEFMLINESTALTCTSSGCSVCSQNLFPSPNCYGIPLSSNSGTLSSVSATFINADIVLRTVHDKTDASIHYFVPNHKLKIYESSGRRSVDAHRKKITKMIRAIIASFSPRKGTVVLAPFLRILFPSLLRGNRSSRQGKSAPSKRGKRKRRAP